MKTGKRENGKTGKREDVKTGRREDGKMENRAALLRAAATGAGFVLLLGLLLAATQVTPGKRIKDYPHTNRAPDEAVFIMEHTNRAGPGPTETNLHISALELAQQFTNPLASTVALLSVSNNIVTNATDILWTNSLGFLRPTTNNPVAIASTGLLGGLVVTQDIRFLGHNATSNYIWVATNATTGEGEWRDISALLSPVGIIPRTNMLNIQYEPVRGSTWYSGTNGIPTTNQARAGLEFRPFWRSLWMGDLGDGVHPSNLGGQGTNYQNNTNIGVCTSGQGSNVQVKANYSAIGGGAVNLILANSDRSVIAGGYNNFIDTNSPSSTIGGGGFNQIYGRSSTVNNLNATICGGSNNIINADVKLGTFIGGGGDNQINIDSSGYATIVGGIGNLIVLDGAYSFLGGGINNTIGDIPVGGGPSAADASWSVLVGGNNNRCRGIGAFVGGGNANNQLARDNDYSVIVGGQNNDIGTAAGDLESKYASIVGGLNNDINDGATYASILGGRDNRITINSQHATIGGGASNTASDVFCIIPGGLGNLANQAHAFTIGTSNSATAIRAGAIGNLVTNNTAGSVTVGELIYYNTPAVIAGAGTGSTNYTLQVTSPEMVLGSSNVNIVASMGWIDGKTHTWSVSITNSSTSDWGLSWSATSNRVFWSGVHGTNVPSLTNNTRLIMNVKQTGSNCWVTYDSFRPAL